MDASERLARILLNRMPQATPARFHRLVEEWGSARAALEAGGVPARDAEAPAAWLAEWRRLWRTGPFLRLAEDDLAREARGHFRIVLAEDPVYPRRLRVLEDHPPLLYIQGRWPPPEKGILAMVGTRRASAAGRVLARRWAKDLAQEGIIIVSGLASGIDAEAHGGALEAGGWTMGIVGHGLSVEYPEENKRLYARLRESGTVVSEFAFEKEPTRHTFPQRNRIISGMSEAVVVVEAGLRSGAMITARWAADQGREVMAAPGPLSNPHVRGCHFLIKEGARLVESAADILGRPEGSGQREGIGAAGLEGDEKAVWKALKWGPLSVDEIQQATGLAVDLTMTTLLSLELKNRIRKLPGQLYGG